MNRAAFSLVELLVAGMVLVMTAACFCSSMHQFSLYYGRLEARERSTASAANKMEELRSVPFDSLPAFNGTSSEGGSILVSAVAPDLVRIVIGDLTTLRSRY